MLKVKSNTQALSDATMKIGANMNNHSEPESNQAQSQGF